MRTEIDLTLRRLGEGLQRMNEATVQKPLPWRFLDLLCQLDDKEEAVRGKGADMTRLTTTASPPPANWRMSHDQR